MNYRSHFTTTAITASVEEAIIWLRSKAVSNVLKEKNWFNERQMRSWIDSLLACSSTELLSEFVQLGWIPNLEQKRQILVEASLFEWFLKQNFTGNFKIESLIQMSRYWPDPALKHEHYARLLSALISPEILKQARNNELTEVPGKFFQIELLKKQEWRKHIRTDEKLFYENPELFFDLFEDLIPNLPDINLLNVLPAYILHCLKWKFSVLPSQNKVMAKIIAETNAILLDDGETYFGQMLKTTTEREFLLSVITSLYGNDSDADPYIIELVHQLKFKASDFPEDFIKKLNKIGRAEQMLPNCKLLVEMGEHGLLDTFWRIGLERRDDGLVNLLLDFKEPTLSEVSIMVHGMMETSLAKTLPRLPLVTQERIAKVQALIGGHKS